MSNHFHLVVETPKAILVAGMKWLLAAYTGRFNRRHKQFGHWEHYGRERRETAEAQAEGIVRSELKRRHWREEELAGAPKGMRRRWRWQCGCERRRR